MPKALQEADIDPIAEQVDQEMMETGEQVGIAQHKFDPNGSYGDLSDGGRVGQVALYPTPESGRLHYDKKEGFRKEPGRPTVRNVWMWDGRPSSIPLAYEPSGKRHDGGRKYLLKRHCTVCMYTGFYGAVCPQCRKDGRRLAPSVPAFYLKKEQVPAKGVFFGTVACFHRNCVRRGEYGFLDEAQMREHASSRHRREYQAFKEAQQSHSDTEIASLRQQLNAIMIAAVAKPTAPAPARTPCGCGGSYSTRSSRVGHIRSRTHQDWVKQKQPA